MSAVALRGTEDTFSSLLGDRAMTSTELHYITDAEGNPTGVIVPIDLWHEIASDRGTAYLLRSETTRRRLAEARSRREGIPLEDVLAKLGV